MSQYEVLLFNTSEKKVKAIVPTIPGCEAQGANDGEALAKMHEVLSATLPRMRWATIEVEVEPVVADEELPFSAKMREVLSTTWPRIHRATTEVEDKPTLAEEELPFSEEELEEIAARGPEDPRYWESLEAVAERFHTSLERKGYTLEKMLADLPAVRQALWEQKYAPMLEKGRAEPRGLNFAMSARATLLIVDDDREPRSRVEQK